ncbi:hypothetical protein HOLleu_01229 [Holothuria leucospilota]|uniref:Uncharacterized protein n=1 Tax=Holothuria leucospilota TaxID=206669 RepID=A0A9Q1HJ44_HOLLE|nr:hypothetical protein HOLleu_01229 [Holothuria leucospilota]
MKLSRWKTQRSLKKAHVPPSITLYQFLAHDEDCQLCVGEVWDLVAIQKYFQDGCQTPKEAADFEQLAKLCTGNVDFEKLAAERKDAGFKNVNGDVVARVEPFYFKDHTKVVGNTIRHMKCKMIVDQQSASICSVCKIHRQNLFQIKKKQAVDNPEGRKHTPNVYLELSELRDKVSDLKRNKNLTWRNLTLSQKIKQLMEQEGLQLREEENGAFGSVVASCSQELDALLSEGSSARLLWEQQKKKKGQ